MRAQGIEVPPPQEDTDPSSLWPPTADGFRTAVEERLGDLHDCYETYLQTDPDLGGDLKISFVLAPEDGAATPTEVKISDSNLHHTVLEGCIATIFEEFRFEASGSGMAVTWPLHLVPE